MKDIFNSSDSELSQEEQKVMKIRNSELGLKITEHQKHLKKGMKNDKHDYAKDYIESTDSVSSDRSNSVKYCTKKIPQTC